MAGKPYIIKMTPKVLGEISILSDTCITSSLRGFVQAILNGCSNKDAITLNELERELTAIGSGSTKSLISKNLKTLVASGAVHVRKEPEYVCHILQDLKSLQQYQINQKNNGPQRARGAPVRLNLEEKVNSLVDKLGANFLDFRRDSTPRIESLFCILDAGMKLGRADKRKVIEAKYHIYKNDFITIKSTTRSNTDSDIAHLSDERVMRVINSLLVDELERGKAKAAAGVITEAAAAATEGYVFFDIYDLTRRLGYSPKLQTVNLVRKMIERLRDTTFTVDASNSLYFRSNYMPDAEMDTAEYRYIIEFYARREVLENENGQKTFTERDYFVRVHSLIVANLKTVGRSFISHPQLAFEKDGLAHRLNNWSKAVIGVQSSDRRTHCESIEDFHRRIFPSSRYNNFCRDLISLLRKHSVSEWNEGEGSETTSLLYGYYYKLSWDTAEAVSITKSVDRSRKRIGIVLSIYRDTNDPWVGNDSKHNKALRSTILHNLGEQDVDLVG